ncbi:hypothetical protein ACFQYP_02285 [Nonomuraea antimicrobica]
MKIAVRGVVARLGLLVSALSVCSLSMVATAALPVSVAAGATSGPTSEPGSVAPGRGDGPGPTFLTRFVARDPGVPVAVAGTVVLRADECASRLVVAREERAPSARSYRPSWRATKGTCATNSTRRRSKRTSRTPRRSTTPRAR